MAHNFFFKLLININFLFDSSSHFQPKQHADTRNNVFYLFVCFFYLFVCFFVCFFRKFDLQGLSNRKLSRSEGFELLVQD